MPKKAKRSAAKSKVKAKAKTKTKAAKKPARKVAKKAIKKPAKAAVKKTKAAKIKKAVKKPVKAAKAPKAAKPVRQIVKSTPRVVTPFRKVSKAQKKVKLTQGYKPSDKEEYMSPQQMEYFRQKLTTWKNELSRELSETLDNLKEENWQEPDITDRATVETDTGIELRTRDRYRKLINKINAALDRIDQGNYGYCEETGDEIGIRRLEARPIATLSIEAQERHERDERTHYDEDLEDRLA